MQKVWGAVVLIAAAASCSTMDAAAANEAQFSACRVATIATWTRSYCPANMPSDWVNKSVQMARFVAPVGTETDCQRGTIDAMTDVRRLLRKGGAKLAGPFYEVYVGYVLRDWEQISDCLDAPKQPGQLMRSTRRQYLAC